MQQALKVIAESLVAIILVMGSIGVAVVVPLAGAAVLPAGGAKNKKSLLLLSKLARTLKLLPR